jgi:hypothetical protein
MSSTKEEEEDKLMKNVSSQIEKKKNREEMGEFLRWKNYFDDVDQLGGRFQHSGFFLFAK